MDVSRMSGQIAALNDLIWKAMNSDDDIDHATILNQVQKDLDAIATGRPTRYLQTLIDYPMGR